MPKDWGGKRKIVIVRFMLASAIALFVVAVAQARPPGLEGRWQLNPKESEFLPGEEPPKALIMAITQDDGRVFRWTVTVKLSDGQSGQPGTTSKFSWTPEGALKQVSESAGGIAVEICTFAPDMKKMICDARQTDMEGRAVTYYETFDRL